MRAGCQGYMCKCWKCKGLVQAVVPRCYQDILVPPCRDQVDPGTSVRLLLQFSTFSTVKVVHNPKVTMETRCLYKHLSTGCKVMSVAVCPRFDPLASLSLLEACVLRPPKINQADPVIPTPCFPMGREILLRLGLEGPPANPGFRMFFFSFVCALFFITLTAFFST